MKKRSNRVMASAAAAPLMSGAGGAAACVGGGTETGPIFDRFDVTWAQKLLPSVPHRLVLQSGDTISIVSSATAGQACVTFSRSGVADVVLQLPVSKSIGSTAFDQIVHASAITGGSYKLLIYAFPPLLDTDGSKVQRVMGTFFFDGSGSGDSGGTWGGGK